MGKMNRIHMSILQLSQSGLLPAQEEVRSTLPDHEGLTIYKLSPEEVERLLQAQYGDKLEAVNTNISEKQRHKHGRYNAFS